MLMNLVFVGDRCCDHSPSSGYDQVCSLFPDAGWLSGKQLSAGRWDWIREPARASACPRYLFHVLYGDCSGRALPAILREKHPQAVIVGSVHQPIAKLVEDRAGLAALSAVDAVITVSEIQSRQLADLQVAAARHVVPHGVWTQKFRPRTSTADQPREQALLVGNYLRDWAGARQALGMLARVGIQSVVVGSAAPERLGFTDPRVVVLPRVSEAELAALYDHSAALLLPVVDATASNALLEAMAAGCPVVCPRFPSLVDEYIGDDLDSFQSGRYDVAVDRLLGYVRQPADRAVRSVALRQRAKRFDWSHLRSRYHETYNDIALANATSIDW
jgi:glycosyltransferase involved in cell wall biosynthesis